ERLRAALQAAVFAEQRQRRDIRDRRQGGHQRSTGPRITPTDSVSAASDPQTLRAIGLWTDVHLTESAELDGCRSRGQPAARLRIDSWPLSVWLVASRISTPTSSPGAPRPVKFTTL